MFRVGPVDEEQLRDPGPVGEQQPRDPFANLDPRNPPHPSSRLGQDVIRRSNQLRKMYIGRRR
eukprot:1036154-Amphidinium_carterae.1